MSNTRTQGQKANQLNPRKVADALYNDVPVEHQGWLIRINGETDTVEVFPPEGDSRYQAFETDLCHLDRAVADFCKFAAMPIPGVNMYPKDQVPVGSPKKLLGPDSSVGEGWKNPKVNERPTGLDQKGTSAPNKNLGVDTSSQNVPHFNPAINKRPKDPTGRGGLPNTDLGPDSSGAPTNWRDRVVKVQEDGRTGRRESLHEVKKPRRGPGQLGYGKAQMGEEAAPMVDGSGPSGGVVGQRRAESDPFSVTPVEEPGKRPNKGETPSNPKDVIFTEQGEGKDERDETEGKQGRIVDSFQYPRVDASEVYRQMAARRPSEELLRDIMDPKKWAAANLMDPKRAQELEWLPEEGEVEDDYYRPSSEDLFLYITNTGELYRNVQGIINNLGRKVKNGMFDESRSVDLWKYLADEGAQRYAMELKDSLPNAPWHQIFPNDLRMEAAQHLADAYNPRILRGEFGDVWPRRGQMASPAPAPTPVSAESGGEVQAVAPEGWEDTVKKMKKHPEIDNPWALAWSMKNKGDKPGGSKEECKEAAPPAGVEQGVFHGSGEVPSDERPVRARRQAGPRLRENWGVDGAYGRDLEAESGEELHALTLALGGQEVDWSKFRPTMPAGGEGEEAEEEKNPQPEGPKAQGGGSPSSMSPTTPAVTAQMEHEEFEAAEDGLGFFNLRDAYDYYTGMFGAEAPEWSAQEFQKWCSKNLRHKRPEDYTQEDMNAAFEASQGGSQLPGVAASRRSAGPADFIDPNEPKDKGSPTDEFVRQEDNPPVETGQQMGAGSSLKLGRRQAGGFYDDDEGFDENSPENLAENYINGNWKYVINAIKGNVGLAFAVMASLPSEEQQEFSQFMQRATASKEAVDEKAKDYWKGYFGDYGKDLTEEKERKQPPTKRPKKDDAKEARRQAMLRAKREAQAAAPLAQPAPPAQSPTNPPASGAPPATPGAPAAPKPAPAPAAPGGPKPGGPMPAGTGDQGLQVLGWTDEDISLMDEADKKKILQIQLSKPGTKAKPKTPGSDTKTPGAPGAPAGNAPTVPSIPPSPIAPTPGPVPAGPTPGPAAPKPTAAAHERLAAMIVKKLERRKAIKAQVTPSQSADPGMTPPVGVAPAQQPAAPQGGPTAPPGKSAPGAGAAPPKEPSSGGEGSAEQKAFDILRSVQQSNVSASSPEQVLSAKVSDLARRLLTEVGMTTTEAKQLFGIPSDGGLDKLFQ